MGQAATVCLVVYLPTEEERREIFAIHLRKRNRDPDVFDLGALGQITEGYSGADIEQVVIVGLKLAYHAGGELTSECLLSAIPQVRPLSQTDPERVAAMTTWLERHTRAAVSLRG